MAYLIDRWGEMSRGRRVILLIQPALFLLSLVLYLTLGQQQMVSYRSGHLRYEQQGNAAIYSGRVDGYPIKYAVYSGPVVEFWLNGKLDSTYTVTEDPTAIPDTEEAIGFGQHFFTGVEVRREGEVWFRGAYSPYWLVDENGSSDLSEIIVVAGNSAPVPDPAPTPKNIITMANGPETFSRGHLEFILLSLLLSAICLATLLFEDQLFRWDLSFRIQNPDRAEPSEWELFTRWVGWIVLTGCALLGYALGSGLIITS